MIRSHVKIFENYRSAHPRYPISSTTPLRISDQYTRDDKSSIYSKYQEHDKMVIEMRKLTSRLPDRLHEIERHQESVRNKISRIETLYSEAALPGFIEMPELERSIHNLRIEITKDLNTISSFINKILKEGEDFENPYYQLTVNVGIALNIKLREDSIKFQSVQSKYIKNLKDQQITKKNSFSFDVEPISFATDSSLVEILPERSQSRYGSVAGQQELLSQKSKSNIPGMKTLAIQQQNMVEMRDSEIREIEQSVISIASIMRNLNDLVIEQGSLFDRIDHNMEQFALHIGKSVKHLEGTAKTQKTYRSSLLILLLIVLIVLVMIAIFVKTHQKTSPESKVS